MTNTPQPVHEDITQDMWAAIDGIIEAHRAIPGSIITVLRECQDAVGYLPPELLHYISAGMILPASQVFGVATFYSLFSLKPKGRHTVKVCLGTACYVKGIKEVMNRITNEHSIKEGETTADRRYTLEGVRCLGACGLAPVMVIDQDVHGIVSSDNVVELLKGYE